METNHPNAIYKTNLRSFLAEADKDVYIMATQRNLKDNVHYHIHVTGYKANGQLLKLVILTAEVRYPLSNVDHKTAMIANTSLLDEMVSRIKAVGCNCIAGTISAEMVLGTIDDDLKPFLASLKKAV